MSGPLQNDSKAPLLKMKPTQLLEHGEVELVPILSLYHPCTCIHNMGRYSSWYPRRKVNTNPATNSSTMAFCLQNTLVQQLVGVANQYLTWVKPHLMRWSLYQMLLGWPRSWDQTNQEPNQILLFCWRKVAIKWLLMTFCYTHRPVPCSAIIREASCCSRWEQIQRPTAGQVCREWETWDVSIQAPPLGHRELCERGDRKSLRARGDGGHHQGLLDTTGYGHIWTQTLRQHEQGLHGVKWDPRTECRSGKDPHPWSRNSLQLIDTCKWKQFSPRKSQRESKPLLRVGPISSSRWPTLKDSKDIFGGSLLHNAKSWLYCCCCH